MLTPVELNGVTFKNGWGYRKSEVDEFRTDVLTDYEALYRNNIELKDKIAMLSEGIQHYKSIEDSMQKALVLAERTAEEVINAAHDAAKNIKEDAANQAKQDLYDTIHEKEVLESKIESLRQEYFKYKAQFKQFMKTQDEILDSAEFTLNPREQQH